MKIMISCKEASRIISDKMDRPLPLSKHILLKMHLVICKTCGYFQERVHSLSNLLGMHTRMEKEGSYDDGSRLSDKALSEIKSSMKEKHS